MDSVRTLPSRARRFPVGLPLKYREAGAADWHDGITVNMSNSGVLFQAGTGFPLKTSIEIEMTLPVVLPGRPAARIAGRGAVVRSSPTNEAGSGFVMAAAIKSRRLVTKHGEVGESGNNEHRH